MRILEIGDPAPWFSIASSVNPLFHFSLVGGRRVILFFFGSVGFEAARTILKSYQALHREFDELQIARFGVSMDPLDRDRNRPSEIAPSFTYFWDLEKQISHRYGVCKTIQQEEGVGFHYQPHTFFLNENLQVLNVFPIDDPIHHAEQVLRFAKTLPPQEEPQIATRHAPVLVVPNVLDKAFCQRLIDLYETDGGSPSGFMRQINGKTVGVFDDNFKKRRDYFIRDTKLQRQLNTLMIRRVLPEVEKAFHYKITRFERYLVACYEASVKGHFNAHRDNTTQGTLHRRFAMTLNLNVGEYTGGYLRFPEYSPHGYRGETGSAIIFSCSLLHEATPVTSGRRFALLSFFYGEEDAQIREENLRFLVNEPDGESQPVGSV